MRTDDFNYFLPEALIAQKPLATRDCSRLLVVDRATGLITHRARFTDLLDYVRAGDLIVLNDSRVIPARLRGRKAVGGGEVEILLLEEIFRNHWWTLLRPGKRVRPGTELVFGGVAPMTPVRATVLEKNAEGHCRVEFHDVANIRDLLDQVGEVPLPPYILRPLEESDQQRYQTVYAQTSGSVAAPTAGLHFTEELLASLHERGVETAFVTLHVGLGTFAPVKAADLASHMMHEERFELGVETAARVNAARAAGRRVIAVGTTTVRVLESVAAQHDGKLQATTGRTRIFIYPPFQFRVVDALLTNFHLPRSTLLMLVSAFAAPGEMGGRELMLKAYGEAVAREYRFFSYGDAMLVM